MAAMVFKGTSGVHLLLVPNMFGLGNGKQGAHCPLEVLATSLLEAFNGATPAIFNNFNVAVANREVLTLNVWLLIGIHCTVFEGREFSAQRFELAEHVLVVFFDVMLLILFDDKAEVLDLALPLRGREHRPRPHSVSLNLLISVLSRLRLLAEKQAGAARVVRRQRSLRLRLFIGINGKIER